VFCLSGFSEPVAVFSTRYVELWADVRGILTNDVFSIELIPRLVERLAFRLIAELSLSKNDPEFAASAMLRSIMAGEGLVASPNSIASLEQEPISSAYMACWFYGVAHELGHFANSSRDDHKALLSNDLKAEALDAARSNPKGFILGTDVIRSEGLADIFATSVLFQSTCDILEHLHEQSSAPANVNEFEFLSFVAEMVISLNIVAIIDRCRRTAHLACMPAPPRGHRLDAMLHPVAIDSRLCMIRFYLEHSGSVYLFGESPSPSQREKVSAAIDSVVQHLKPKIDAVDNGLAHAIEFSLDRQRRPFFTGLLTTFQQTLKADPIAAALGLVEVKQFCSLAASLGKSSPVFDAISNVAADPTASWEMRAHVQPVYTYLCPWLESADGTAQPFGLDTRHGHLIFVFVAGGDAELYEQYRKASASLLPDGYEMKSVAIMAENAKQLRDAIALRLPLDEQFCVVVEGTPDFDGYIRELGDGAIWRDG
jgi:hypothetical protein